MISKRIVFNNIIFFCIQGYYDAQPSTDEQVLRAGQLASIILNRPLTIYTADANNIVDGIYTAATFTKNNNAIVISKSLENNQDSFDDEAIVVNILSEYYAASSKVYYVFALLIACAALFMLFVLGFSYLSQIIDTTPNSRLGLIIAAVIFIGGFYFAAGISIVNFWTCRADKKAVKKSGIAPEKLAQTLYAGIFVIPKSGIPVINAKLHIKNMVKRIEALLKNKE